MEKINLPAPDKYGIIKALPNELSEGNIQKLKKFGTFMFLYDLIQDYFVDSVKSSSQFSITLIFQ